MSLATLLNLALLTTTALANVFTITASLEDSPLDGAVINAGGGSLYIGLPAPDTFCPDPPVTPADCPNGTETVLSSMNAMWVST